MKHVAVRARILASGVAALAVTAAALATAAALPTAQASSPARPPAPVVVGADTDGDALPDAWETNGYDANADGIVDVDLPAMGATPDHKDLFVEMDYMSGRLASTAALDRIVAVFADAPVGNPDGSSGISIHLDAGTARGTAYDLGGGNQVPYDSNLKPALRQVKSLKAAHFDPDRAAVFHYMLWADYYDSSCSSGNAFAIPNDTFIVTMGPRCAWTVNDNMNVGTFVHELGHNLGLKHGGTDHVNYKPNYLSVMNYFFQFNGVPKSGGGANFGYSDFAPPALGESSLRESLGLNTAEAAGWLTKWKCPDGTTRTSGAANLGIDWNCDGDATDTTSADINDDNTTTTLTAQDNWANIVFGGGAVGGGANQGKVSEDGLRELTKKEWLELRKSSR